MTMDLSPPPRRPRVESIVPMINVVFLLLIFFLMTAQIAPPEPFQVTLPAADRENPAEGDFTLYISAEGLVAFRDMLGEEAVAEAVANAEGDAMLLRADAGVEGVAIARLLQELANLGVEDVTLVTAAGQ
ncbi:MAG: biopolymer transporter ExbD [Pseudomonadota bacterium]